jgi:hypothetical protein
MAADMNLEDDLIYYTRRAHQERERAALAKDVTSEIIHRTLAEAYEQRLGQGA